MRNDTDFLSCPERQSTLRNGNIGNSQLFTNFLRARYLRIAIVCVVIALIPLSLMRFRNSTKFEYRGTLPVSAEVYIERETRTSPFLHKPEVQLEHKKLYVLSKTRRSADSLECHDPLNGSCSGATGMSDNRQQNEIVLHQQVSQGFLVNNGSPQQVIQGLQVKNGSPQQVSQGFQVNNGSSQQVSRGLQGNLNPILQSTLPPQGNSSKPQQLPTGSGNNNGSSQISTLSSQKHKSSIPETDHCAYSNIPNRQMFDCSKLRPSAHNIFFLETSCASGPIPKGYGDPTLSEKKACSIYSAAFHNPSRNVILLYTCPFQRNFTWTKDWQVLFDMRNFFFARLDLQEFYSNSVLSDFYHGLLMKSSHPVEHHSDFLRLVVLYFYGGTYLDLDHISLRPLDDLGFNFLSTQGPLGEDYLSNAGMNFEPRHQLVKELLSSAVGDYMPDAWNVIGPALFTKVTKRYCNVDHFDHFNITHLTSCNISILADYVFYPLDYHHWYLFYQSGNWSTIKPMLDRSYGAHYWNHKGKLPLFIGSDQPIVKLAGDNCRLICENAGEILS